MGVEWSLQPVNPRDHCRVSCALVETSPIDFISNSLPEKPLPSVNRTQTMAKKSQPQTNESSGEKIKATSANLTQNEYVLHELHSSGLFYTLGLWNCT